MLPSTDYLKDWKGPAHLGAQKVRVLAFLAKQTPGTST